MSTLRARPLTAEDFAPFGQVIALGGAFTPINAGRCRRYSDLARPEILEGHTGISLFQAEIRALPLPLTLMERHPLGSQAFLPMGGSDYLVAVALDEGGRPGPPTAFLARQDQGIQLGRGVWHGVLAPISGSGLFAVVDRIGPGANLEEHPLDPPPLIDLAPG